MPDTSVSPAPYKSARVLVVDDEKLLAWTMAKVLSKAGYDVVTFNNPCLVLEEFRSRQVDLVISDVVMPEMSGIDLAIQLEQYQPGNKIMLLSGQANTLQLMAKATAKGFDFEVFAKPIAPDDLLRLVRERVGSHKP